MYDGEAPQDEQEPTELTGENPPADGSAPDNPNAPAPDENRRLGDFDLLREIGRGGMGVVHEARQISLNRRVALEALPPGLGLTEHAVNRFEREAQAAANLDHSHT